MVKVYTLMYKYSNFDENDYLSKSSSDCILEEEWNDMRNILDGSTIKAPENIITNILEFARNY